MSKYSKDYSYTWRYSWGWAARDIQRRNLRAAIRMLWQALMWGHSGETCQICGRSYLLWWADNDLYSEVTGRTPVDGDNMGGLYCLKCFDSLAEDKGMCLQWTPNILCRREIHE
jgi:hypothetical protein